MPANLIAVATRCRDLLHLFGRETKQLGDLRYTEPAQQTAHNLGLAFRLTTFEANRVVPVDNFLIYKNIIRLDRPN